MGRVLPLKLGLWTGFRLVIRTGRASEGPVRVMRVRLGLALDSEKVLRLWELTRRSTNIVGKRPIFPLFRTNLGPSGSSAPSNTPTGLSAAELLFLQGVLAFLGFKTGPG